MNFKKQDEDQSPAEIRELKSRIADLHNPVRYVIYSDLLPNGRWRLFLNVSDGTFCDQLDTATLFKRNMLPKPIIFTKSYTKRASQFFKRHADLIGQYEKTLRLLELDPYHPSLGLHPLKGKLQSLHSVSINFTCRVTIELIVTEKAIIPVNIGTHEEAYR